jgi:WD40 repeat protein
MHQVDMSIRDAMRAMESAKLKAEFARAGMRPKIGEAIQKAADDVWTEMGRSLFRSVPTDEAEGIAMADIAYGIAEASAKIIPITRNHAVDLLSLSMYFFHPIQQCAQQVYYTALPLSPTSSRICDDPFQCITDNRLSRITPRITAFLGAPNKWGLLLRTIDVRPRQLTCIATSAQRIIAACEDIVNIYDAVTFVLRQSLRTPETVTKVQGAPDGSTLFFAHPYSVTMWDLQTGGLTHTFSTQSEITNIAVSMTGGHIACGSSDGSVTFWDTHTKVEGEGFGNGQPVVTICWLSPLKLAVATQRVVFIRDISIGETSASFSIPGRVWGMIYSPSLDRSKLLVGASQPDKKTGRSSAFLTVITFDLERVSGAQPQELLYTQPLTRPGEELSNPALADKVIACITPPRGVQSFDTKTWCSTGNLPLLDAATSVAVSLNRNLVAQTKNSIQVFSLDVLRAHKAHNDARTSHVYPLGEKYIVCLQLNRNLTILESSTLHELHNTSPLGWSPTDELPHAGASFSCGLIAEFGVSMVMEAWRLGTPLPEWTGEADEDTPLSGLSPDCTRIVTFYDSPRRELRVKDTEGGTVLANLLLGDDELEMGEVYDITFDSDTRFHLKIDGPGRHVQVPHDIIPSPSGPHSHTITRGEPVPLSKLRPAPPYALDANCEWVVDAESRKICWISPGNVRRGGGGHFWVGLSLIMVGGDGVVRKVTFREPDS